MTHTVLLIEDNEQNRYLATYLLEQGGYRVVSVSDGAAALPLAHETRPDIILLDIQLPRLSGHDVARLLRGDETLRAVPIIAVTSYAMPGDRDKAFAAGCDGYIEKPIDPYTFVAEVSKCLRPLE